MRYVLQAVRNDAAEGLGVKLGDAVAADKGVGEGGVVRRAGAGDGETEGVVCRGRAEVRRGERGRVV